MTAIHQHCSKGARSLGAVGQSLGWRASGQLGPGLVGFWRRSSNLLSLSLSLVGALEREQASRRAPHRNSRFVAVIQREHGPLACMQQAPQHHRMTPLHVPPRQSGCKFLSFFAEQTKLAPGNHCSSEAASSCRLSLASELAPYRTSAHVQSINQATASPPPWPPLGEPMRGGGGAPQTMPRDRELVCELAKG